MTLKVPASTPSGLSVLSLNTKTGLCNDGASSCIPPESVIMRYACLAKLWKSTTSSGSINSILGWFPKYFCAISLTLGFICIG